jgi:DNA-binding NarL/FixJ family response regulator
MDELADALVPIAAELVGTVRDYGPADVAAVLARVPDGRLDALAVVLAAMVDPDARPSDLLKWTTEPARSREFTPKAYNLRSLPPNELGRHPERRAEVARMSAAGCSADEISARLGITPRSVIRHRAAIREALEKAS